MMGSANPAGRYFERLRRASRRATRRSRTERLPRSDEELLSYALKVLDERCAGVLVRDIDGGAWRLELIEYIAHDPAVPVEARRPLWKALSSVGVTPTSGVLE